MKTNDTGATPHDSGGSFFAQFMARLTKYLEDGKKPGILRQLGFESLADYAKDFISTNMPNPQGAERNAIIVLVDQQLPGLSQRELADVVGTSVGTANRVLNGDETGGGNRGHGGARK